MGVQGVYRGEPCPIDWNAPPSRDFSRPFLGERTAAVGQSYIDDLGLGYIAAFLEAEGSFGSSWQHRDRYYISVVAYQSPRNPHPLRLLLSLLGGGIAYSKSSDPHRVNTWGASGERAVRVMRLIYPLMSPWRLSQIDKALNAWKNQPWGIYPDMPKDVIVVDMKGLHP